jgi:hypothetical protein
MQRQIRFHFCRSALCFQTIDELPKLIFEKKLLKKTAGLCWSILREIIMKAFRISKRRGAMAQRFFQLLSMSERQGILVVASVVIIKSMLKKEARKLFKEKRDSLSDSERMKLDDLILIHFQTIELPFVDYVLSFYPIDDYNEINSFILTGLPAFQKPQPPYLLS